MQRELIENIININAKIEDVCSSINKDKEAPILEIADYAVVGDILEIIPKLIEHLKN